MANATVRQMMSDRRCFGSAVDLRADIGHFDIAAVKAFGWL
jgi:hypothetical protein